MTGTIRTLRVDKGFGFIKSEAGQDYFFHQNAIYGGGIADLREGGGVEFEGTDSPKGPRAANGKGTPTEQKRGSRVGRREGAKRRLERAQRGCRGRASGL